MKTHFLYAVVYCLTFGILWGQQHYTLNQCLTYAKLNSSTLKIASRESDIASKKVMEQIGSALPQIDVSGTWINNTQSPTSLMPAEFFGGASGTYIALKMSQKYTVTSNITLKQKIFDPSVWVGLKAANISDDYYKQNSEKTNETVLYNVCLAYYQAVVAQRQWKNYQTMLSVSEQTLHSTELKHHTGVARQVDVDKIKVSYNNTHTQLQNAELAYRQAVNNLRYVIGMPMSDAIMVDDSLSEDAMLPLSASEPQLHQHIDYRLQLTSVHIAEAKQLNDVVAYLPSLSFTAVYSYEGMGMNFKIPSSSWFGSSYIGLILNIPIFSGFQRLSRVEQGALGIEEANEALRQTEQLLQATYSNSELQLRDAADNIRKEKENLALAESVYRNTQLEFQQGRGSSLDVVQSESSLRDAQNNYFNKLLTLFTARLEYERSKGTLTAFIHTLEQ